MVNVKNVTVTKRDQTVPVARLVRGDSESTQLTLHVNRFDGGVDLSKLGWCIKMAAANGETDIQPVYPEIGPAWIVYEAVRV